MNGSDMDEEADPLENPDRYERLREDSSLSAFAEPDEPAFTAESFPAKAVNEPSPESTEADEPVWTDEQRRDWKNLQVAREQFHSEYADAVRRCGLDEHSVSPGNALEVLHAINRILDVEIDRQGISIADVAGFLALSDAKKVDELFRLFPPAGDVRGLSSAITSAKERIAKIESDIKAREQSCQSLASSIAELSLPAGALPEVQAEIAKVEREYYDARDEVTREHARIEHDAQMVAQAPRNQNAKELATVALVERPQFSVAVNGSPVQGSLPTSSPQPHATLSRPVPASTEGRDALERVLSALEQAGCDGCAARMVIKRELKTMREAVNG